jgi:predicted Abi (CAAX) family protease
MKVAREGGPWPECVPLILLTLFLLALPSVLVLLLGQRAKVFLPSVRDWMNANSWIVSELVIMLCIGITIDSIASG